MIYKQMADRKETKADPEPFDYFYFIPFATLKGP